MTIIVHHLQDSRSQRVLWLLEELGVPYEIKRYERNAMTRLAPPELLAIHPLGKSPVITIDGVVVAETGAIFEALLDRFDSTHRLHPAREHADYKTHRYWMHYAEGSAMPPLVMKLIMGMIPDQTGPAFGFVDAQIALHLKYQESVVVEKGGFLGPEISAADIIMSFPIEAANVRANLAEAAPKLAAWLTKVRSRSGYVAALEKGGAYSFA
ncbi:MAG: glutathione S-transferase [Pseudomonadota bacterium]